LGAREGVDRRARLHLLPRAEHDVEHDERRDDDTHGVLADGDADDRDRDEHDVHRVRELPEQDPPPRRRGLGDDLVGAVALEARAGLGGGEAVLGVRPEGRHDGGRVLGVPGGALGGPGARRAGGAGGVRAGLRDRSAHGPIVAPKAADGAGNDAARPRTAGLRSGGRAGGGRGEAGQARRSRRALTQTSTTSHAAMTTVPAMTTFGSHVRESPPDASRNAGFTRRSTLASHTTTPAKSAAVTVFTTASPTVHRPRTYVRIVSTTSTATTARSASVHVGHMSGCSTGIAVPSDSWNHETVRWSRSAAATSASRPTDTTVSTSETARGARSAGRRSTVHGPPVRSSGPRGSP